MLLNVVPLAVSLPDGLETIFDLINARRRQGGEGRLCRGRQDRLFNAAGMGGAVGGCAV